MKTVKSFLLLAAMLLSVTAMAQDRPQRGQGQGRGQGGRMHQTVAQRAERETSRIHQAVELTDKQIESVYVISYKYAAQDSVRMNEMHAQRGQGQQMDREAMMKQMQERQAAKAAEIKAVLTPEQQEKYDAMIKEQQERMRQGGPRPGGEGGPRPGGEGGFGGPEGGPQGAGPFTL